MTATDTADSRGALLSTARATIRRAARDPMMRNSLAIMSSTVVTSLLGYVFWMIAARSFDQEANGTAAATTSAVQATVLVASVGAAAALVEWLPRSADAVEWRQRVTCGLLVSVLTAVTGAAIVIGVLGVAVGTLPQLATPLGAALFTAACVFFAAGLVVDYVAVAEHRGGLLLTRNLVLCGVRIPLIMIPVSAVTGQDSILAAWAVSAGLSMVWVALSFGSRNGHSLRPDTTALRLHLRQMASSLVGQHLVTVTAMLAGYLLPVVVYARLSGADNAHFYITWMLCSVFFIISPAVSAALFVEGAAQSADIRRLVRRCLLIVTGLLALPMLAYLAGGRLLLGLFGSDYVAQGHVLLLVLTLSAIPDAITNIAVAVLRITGRMYAALALNGGMLVMCLAATYVVLPATGIVGAGWCWLGSQTLGALACAAYWRRIVGRSTADAVAAEAAMADSFPVLAEGADR